MGLGQEEGQGDRVIPCKIPWRVALAPCLQGKGNHLTPDSHPWGDKEPAEYIPVWPVKGWFSGTSNPQDFQESGGEIWVLVTCVSTWAAGVPDGDRGHGGEGQCLPQHENDSCRLPL